MMSKSGSAPALITTGCPSSIGSEVVLKGIFGPPGARRPFAERKKITAPLVLLGDCAQMLETAHGLGYPRSLLTQLEGAVRESWPDDKRKSLEPEETVLLQVGEPLRSQDRKWGKISAAGGRAQLEYVETGFELVKQFGGALVTAAVSKEAIARSGLSRAKRFRGHTEWLQELDGASYSSMCFWSERLTTSLVTTHIPLKKVSRAISPEGVCRAIVELTDLILRTVGGRPQIAVASLNPHAGEGRLLGGEEAELILPGIEAAKQLIGRRAKILGPIGAETAYRKAVAGAYSGVVAMYHDQATIPMKLIDFGGAVNVTQGLSIVRTSVDHGTAHDIAGRWQADGRGLRSAVELGVTLSNKKRRLALVESSALR
ncbi:MAG: 4-hydroxythreonine-4-phosphate dehydrogenase PdxA [Polyangiaceae bacterium]|nr:4-hydroxythreonine-4-phosphate dehydrogenase PdxA [Polyangiaceae bacterium]